jgi:hypothetical protein
MLVNIDEAFSSDNATFTCTRTAQRTCETQLCAQLAIGYANSCSITHCLMSEWCCIQQQVACYRTAISRSEQHYNGWFGLGEVYERQEKFALAEIHFRYVSCHVTIPRRACCIDSFQQ